MRFCLRAAEGTCARAASCTGENDCAGAAICTRESSCAGEGDYSRKRGTPLSRSVVFEKDGDAENAITEYKTAIKEYPDYTAAHYNLGRLYLDRKGYADAITEFKTVIRLKPDDADAHNNLGLALKHNGNLIDAAIEYREAVRLNPKMASAQNNLANLLYARRDFAGAIEHSGRPWRSIRRALRRT